MKTKKITPGNATSAYVAELARGAKLKPAKGRARTVKAWACLYNDGKLHHVSNSENDLCINWVPCTVAYVVPKKIRRKK